MKEQAVNSYTPKVIASCWCGSPHLEHTHIWIKADPIGNEHRMLQTAQWYNLMSLMYKLGITVFY